MINLQTDSQDNFITKMAGTGTCTGHFKPQ
jgi:hypothetical protein